MGNHQFKSLFGQKSAIAALRRALDADCLPGCYLLTGATGVGKGAVALALAQAAACLRPVRDPFDSCGECESCRRSSSDTNPELKQFFPAGDYTQIGQFWERDGKSDSGILSRTLQFAPVIGKKRVYIVDRAESLTEAAANSLLKVLEEPPSYALFILLSPGTSRVLPTIVSRSQVVRLTASPRADLARYLNEELSIEWARSELLAAFSEGRTGQAVRMAMTPTVGQEIAAVMDFAVTIPGAPPVRALRLAEQLRKLSGQLKALVGDDRPPESGEDSESVSSSKEKSTRRQVAAALDVMVLFYRDLVACSAGGRARETVINRDRAESIMTIARTDQPSRWVSSLDAILIARRRLDANASIPLLTETLCMALVRT